MYIGRKISLVLCGLILAGCFAISGCSGNKGNKNVDQVTYNDVISAENIQEDNTEDNEEAQKSTGKTDREKYLRTIVAAENSETAFLAYYDGNDYLCEYSFFDITRDGENEIIIKNGSCEADYMYDIYTYRDDSAVKLGSFDANHSTLVCEDGYLVIHSAVQGYETAQRITYKDGALAAEQILDRDVGMSGEYTDWTLSVNTHSSERLLYPDNRDLSQTFVGTTGLGSKYCGDFTVNFPASWKEKYVCEFVEHDMHYEMYFYEKESYGNSGNGELFCLKVYPEDMGYDENSPECAYVLKTPYELGSGSIDYEKEYVLVIYPETLNISPEYMDTYSAMKADIPSIIDNITCVDGVVAQRINK